MEKEQSGKTLFRGELALVIAVLVNSFGVVLMLYSGAGISAISSVPYAFSLAFPALTLGTWTYLFQGTLIASLMIMRRKWVWPYLFSFVVGFVFSELLDVHELWIDVLPYTLPWRVVYFVVSYLLICFGIALSNRCGQRPEQHRKSAVPAAGSRRKCWQKAPAQYYGKQTGYRNNAMGRGRPQW